MSTGLVWLLGLGELCHGLQEGWGNRVRREKESLRFRQVKGMNVLTKELDIGPSRRR